jgi:hypothetical protein
MLIKAFFKVAVADKLASHFKRKGAKDQGLNIKTAKRHRNSTPQETNIRLTGVAHLYAGRNN